MQKQKSQAEDIVKGIISSKEGYSVASSEEIQLRRGTGYKIAVKNSPVIEYAAYTLKSDFQKLLSFCLLLNTNFPFNINEINTVITKAIILLNCSFKLNR